MRRLLPLALLLVACSKPAEAPKLVEDVSSRKILQLPSAGTPEEMARMMDVPIYPGAEAPQDMSEKPKKRTDGGIGYSLVLATSDPVKKVGAWYGKELGVSALPSNVGMTIVGMTKKGNQAIVTVGTEAGRTLIRAKAIAYPQKSSTP